MIAFFGTFSSADLVFMPRLEDAFGLYAKMLIGLYLISIGIAWIVGPKREKAKSKGTGSNIVTLVFAAAMIDESRKGGRHSSKRLPNKV